MDQIDVGRWGQPEHLP